MQAFSTLMIETIAATFHALSAGRTLPSPQDFPVERAYLKYIFNLEKKENEEELEVVIHARAKVIFDVCNSHSSPTSTLTKAPAGYYFLDQPSYGQTLMACDDFKVEVCDIALTDNVFPYCSQTPIVIHAFGGIHVWTQVRSKKSPGQLSSLEATLL
ncbi:hypothetical protein [Pseudomonas rhodesiae]|uniref:hypothetical protein n=1 Tax=Pseudomonas rhodesiae TaxID=76760 RepID=UPI0032B0F4BC